MTTPRLLATLPLALLALAACDRVPGDALTRCEADLRIGAAKTDILFVIDDSGSMSEEQANLSSNLAAFVDALVNAPVANDFQIGVTNSSVVGFTSGDDAYRTTGTPIPPSAGIPYPDGALVAIDRDVGGAPIPGDLIWTSEGGFGGARILSAGSPTLVADFGANVLQGIYGSGKEQSFRAARLALADRIDDGVNAGFLRPGARLAVVFVSDEDDCSDADANVTTNAACHTLSTKQTQLDDIQEFADFLRGPIAGELRDVVVAAIAGLAPGTLAPSCGEAQCANQACGDAFDQGDRFVDLVTELGPLKTRLGSICDDSFHTILQEIADMLVAQTVPLEGAPADWRMLVAGVERSDAAIPCEIALDGSDEAAAADAVYTPPLQGRAPTLTFQNGCRLEQGDRLLLNVVCAG